MHESILEKITTETWLNEAIKKANWEYFGGIFDWRLWKVQCWVESSFNIKARSKVGAMGLMQIMPTTWEDIKSKININNPWNAEQNIRAGIYYMRQMWDSWDQFRDYQRRIRYALASYHAGKTNIKKMLVTSIRERKDLKEEAADWKCASAYLKDITGEHNALSTIEYVGRIMQIFERISRGN